MPPAVKVAIIGAGSAGMVMAKQILDVSAKLGRAIDFTIFERRNNVGGIWQYDDHIPSGYLAWESDQATLIDVACKSDSGRKLRYAWTGKWPPGPMFDGLRTNIPSDLMAFRDAPFAPGTSLFPSRRIVQEYLEGYAAKHGIAAHTRFRTSVVHLKKDEPSEEWVLTSRVASCDDAAKSHAQDIVERFTHVAVCHGRCNTPNIPNLPGLETFQGEVMHSAWWRDPSTQIKGKKRVLIVGNASSGMDIARELAGYLTRTLPSGITPEDWREQCSKQPYEVFSSWHSLDKPPGMDYNPLNASSPDWSRSIKVFDQIERIEGPKVYFANGAMLDRIDTLIFATGFLFDNPYLDQTTEPLRSRPLLPPSKSDTRSGFPSPTMCNLDDWLLFHIRDESIAFLGLPITVVPFPFTEAQATYVVHRWLDLAPALPRLEKSVAVNDAKRWTSVANRPGNDSEELQRRSADPILRTEHHIFGHPSDVAYVDALLKLLQATRPDAGQTPTWQQDYKGDGMGNGQPKGPEGLFATTQWRKERRSNSKKLRRDVLGY